MRDEKTIIDECNALFNYQISKEIKRNERVGRNEITLSWFNREIFNLTIDFTPLDWRKIRDNSYWIKYGNIQRSSYAGELTYSDTELAKKKLLLYRIQQYKLQ
jgi:hypothetical protein